MWPLVRSLAILSVSFLVCKIRVNSSSHRPPKFAQTDPIWDIGIVIYFLGQDSSTFPFLYIQLANRSSWFTPLMSSFPFQSPAAWTLWKAPPGQAALGSSAAASLRKPCLISPDSLHFPLAVTATHMSISYSSVCSPHQGLCDSYPCNLGLSSVPGTE